MKSCFEKKINKILFFTFLFCSFVHTNAQYGGGNGTTNSPYLIENTTHLSHLSNTQRDWSGKYFRLINSIDMSGISFTPIGNENTIFTGSFDGNNKVISNLTVTTSTTKNGTGLFGTFSGDLFRLGIENININTNTVSRAGAFVGLMVGGSVTFCYSKGGAVLGNSGWMGSIVGGIIDGPIATVQNCYSSTNVKGSWASGGIVGTTRGQHIIDRVAFYGTISNNNPAIVTVQNDKPTNGKNGLEPTNSFYATSSGATDANATSLNDTQLENTGSYTTFDFTNTWKINTIDKYAVLQDDIVIVEPEISFFETIKTKRIASDSNIEWVNFAPGTSGYCEEFWCHPTDTNVMFSGPDMHAAFGTWDGGQSWQAIRNHDGDGLDLRRVIDIQFSTQDPDFGVAFASKQISTNTRGEVYETNDRGRTWSLVSNMGLVHSKLAIHPTNNDIWFLGAGDFWNVKSVRRTQANPNGNKESRASYGYVWKTINHGATWTKVANNISNDLDVGRIIFNPSTPQNMIMATSHGLFVSSNTGETWTASSNGLPNNLPRDLTSHYDTATGEFTLFLVEQTVYTESGSAINSTGGIYKSTDNGSTWSNITGDLGIDFSMINDFSARDRYHRSIGFWFGMSTNDSKTKHTTYPTNVLSLFNRIVVNPLNKNEIYISHNAKHGYGFGPGDIWKTENGGITWYPCARNGKYWIQKKNTSYWNNKTGLSTTTANMKFSHVQTEMDGLNEIQGTRALAINAKGDVFSVVAQQTFRTNDNGDNWEQIDDFETSPGSNKWIGRGNNALPGRFMLLETGVEDRKLLCSGEHGLWQTTDLDGWSNPDAVVVEQIEGQNFDTGGYKSAHSISAVAVHPNNPNIIYSLMDRQTHRGKFRRSLDGGKTWTNIATIFEASSNVSSKLANQSSLIIDPVNPDNIYFIAVHRYVKAVNGTGAGPVLTKGEYGVYRSNDGGFTWTSSNSNLPSNGSVSEIVMHPDNPKTLFISLNSPGALYKSIDGALNWTKMSIPSEIKALNDVFIDRNTKNMFISAGSRTRAYNEGGVWKSTDEGISWERIFKAPFVWQTETSPLDSKIILVSAATQIFSRVHNFKNPGAYLSLDGGDTWVKINKGLAHPGRIVDLKPDPYDKEIIWSAGWGSGWYKAKLNLEKLSIDEITKGNIKDGGLYPNPVSKGVINITGFETKKKVSYYIVDYTGKRHQIGNLNNNQINVSHLNDGLYVVVLMSGNKSINHKFIVKK